MKFYESVTRQWYCCATTIGPGAVDPSSNIAAQEPQPQPEPPTPGAWGQRLRARTESIWKYDIFISITDNGKRAIATKMIV